MIQRILPMLAVLDGTRMAGAYRIAGDPASNPMVIYRSCATGLYQVAWHRQPSRLVVQRYGPPSFYTLINNLHFPREYDQEGLAYRTWAIIVVAYGGCTTSVATRLMFRTHPS